MSVPDFLTWSGSVSESVNPYRPGIPDVGGASFIDDSQFPPDPTTQLTAMAENQNELQIVALSRVVPAAVFYVKVPGGTPSIFAMRSASGILAPSDITVTDLGVGLYDLSCSATKLIQPFGAIATPQLTGDFRCVAYVNGTSNGIRIEMCNSAGTLTDCDFVLLWL